MLKKDPFNIRDWKKNTYYVKLTEKSRVVKWFWNILTRNPKLRKSLYVFITGKLEPDWGYLKPQFSLKLSSGNRATIPECRLEIELPSYKRESELKLDLEKIIEFQKSPCIKKKSDTEPLPSSSEESEETWSSPIKSSLSSWSPKRKASPVVK